MFQLQDVQVKMWNPFLLSLPGSGGRRSGRVARAKLLSIERSCMRRESMNLMSSISVSKEQMTGISLIFKTGRQTNSTPLTRSASLPRPSAVPAATPTV